MGKTRHQRQSSKESTAAPAESYVAPVVVCYGVEHTGKDWTPVRYEIQSGRVVSRTLVDESQRYLQFAYQKASDALDVYGRTLAGMKDGADA